MSLEGKQIGRYRIMHLLGSGGMGDVYLAEDPRIEQQVAIKVIQAEVSRSRRGTLDRDAVFFFQREAKAIVKLDHPNILPLFDYGEENTGDITLIYLVMPYRPEGSLINWLRAYSPGKLLSPNDMAYIVRQTAEALQYAHDCQVIHQDVKPSNLLIRNRMETSSRPDVLLADFGIAILPSTVPDLTLPVRGTPAYMAPEQWDGRPLPASDQYALAIMTYELLTGLLPFQGTPGRMMYQHLNAQLIPPSVHNPRLSSEIDVVLLHALSKQPERRFASVAAFANAFQQAAEGIPDTAVTTLGNPYQSPKSNLPTLYPLMEPYTPSEASMPTMNIWVAQQSTIGIAQGDQAGSQQIDDIGRLSTRLQPIPPTISAAPPRGRIKWRPLIMIVAALLGLALIGGGVLYTTSLPPSSTKVTIVPVSQNVRNSYTISAVTGAPDASQHQVSARLLTFTTTAHSQTVPATGHVNTTATNARGLLYFDNLDLSSPLVLGAGTVITGNDGSTDIGVQIVLDASVSIAPSGSGSAPAHVSVPGSSGNIGYETFNYCSKILPTDAPGSCGCSTPPTSNCNNVWDAINVAPFTGGQDAQNYVDVQQSDIDNAANALIKANTPDPLQVLQPEVQANERIMQSPACKPVVTSDHAAGDKATSITVLVNFVCTGEVYDYNGSQSLAANLLKSQAMTSLDPSYALMGNITTSVTSAMLTDRRKGTITLTVNAQGIWVYQFGSTQKQKLVKLIAGKTKSEAESILVSQPGIKQADIHTSGSQGATLPTDTQQITIVVNAP